MRLIVAVNGSLHRYCLYCLRVSMAVFLPFNCGYPSDVMSATVWKFSIKENWSVSFTLRKTFFRCFYHVYRCKFTYIVISNDIWIPLIYVPYFHTSNIDLFLPSTHVLSFSINVILTFYYCWPGDASANVTPNLRFLSRSFPCICLFAWSLYNNKYIWIFFNFHMKCVLRGGLILCW